MTILLKLLKHQTIAVIMNELFESLALLVV